MAAVVTPAAVLIGAGEQREGYGAVAVAEKGMHIGAEADEGERRGGVACGRRPIQPQRSPKGVILVDWVFKKLKEGAILETSDPRLGRDYLEEEMELVLKLGLLCSVSNAATRPTMRQVTQYLDGDLPLPEISHGSASFGIEASSEESEFVMSFPPSVMKSSDHSMSCTESIFNSDW
ncbi:hypothetical protein Vadar_030098 [Vaccinium darrowii]|uniref:Uncharacterized protein n=1 Tax=Vaccinium darrowii TaxID=229202 RepID=A0ACB7ZET7_9ERIC|nr:hypothetical protein Vadar_030098 [Vaccinium darrowii]